MIVPNPFKFRHEWRPVFTIPRSLSRLFFCQSGLNGFNTTDSHDTKQRTILNHHGKINGVFRRQLDEYRRRAGLPEPEPNLLLIGILSVGFIVCFYQTTKHRPVFVTLGLLSLDQIRERQQIERIP